MLSKTRRKGKVESVGEDNKIEEWRVYICPSFFKEKV